MSSKWTGRSATRRGARSGRRSWCRYLSAIIDDTILVQITGQIHGITGTEVIIDPALEPLSGLAKKCVASCTNIRTYDPDFVIGVIGTLSDGIMKDIEDCLKAALGLP